MRIIRRVLKDLDTQYNFSTTRRVCLLGKDEVLGSAPIVIHQDALLVHDDLLKFSYKETYLTSLSWNRVGIKNNLIVYSYLPSIVYELLKDNIPELTEEFAFYSSYLQRTSEYNTSWANIGDTEIPVYEFGDITKFRRNFAEKFREKYGTIKTYIFPETATKYNLEGTSSLLKVTRGDCFFLFLSKVRTELQDGTGEAYLLRLGAFVNNDTRLEISMSKFVDRFNAALPLQYRKKILGEISNEICRFSNENIQLYNKTPTSKFSPVREINNANMLEIASYREAKANQTLLATITEKIQRNELALSVATEEKKDKIHKVLEELKSQVTDNLPKKEDAVREYQEFNKNTGITIQQITYHGPDIPLIHSLVFSTSKPSRIKVIDSVGAHIDTVYGGPYTISIVRTDEEGLFHTTSISPRDYSTILVKDQNDNLVKIHPHARGFNQRDLRALPNIKAEPCWGEATPLIAEAFWNNDVYYLIHIIMQWIQSTFSEDDWGQSYRFFPRSINET